MRLNKTLKVLNLAKCGLTNEVASYFANGLAQNHSVRKVMLCLNNIGSTGAVNMFRSLEHNTSLEELDLSENWQLAEGDCEAVGCAMERMLNENRTLKVLNLSGCQVTDPIVNHILTGLTKNTSLVTLDMGSPKLSVSRAVSLFQQTTTHPTLSITVGEVNVLGVGRVKIDRRCLWCVIGVTIPEKCVEFFRSLNDSCMTFSMLNVVDLTDQTADHFAFGLAESQSVQVLDLRANGISSTGAVSIFRSLEHNTSLEELDLSENSQLAEGDCEAVGCAIERMLNVNRTIKILNLTDCRLTNEVASYFASGLAQNHSVRKMILHSNNIGSTGAVSIFRSLEHNTSLEELDLSENSQLAENDSEAVGCAVERMLNVNRTLKVLNLSGCQVTDPIVNHILTGLTKNTSLVTIDMGSLKLSVSCAVSLFQQTTTHPTPSITVGEVNVLGVGRVKMDRGSLWCDIGVTIPENCVEFFRALNDSCMTFSMLNVVDLTDQTAEHFAFGLAESQSVQVLDLRANSISSTGAVSIFRSLEHNTSLEELDLSENWQLADGDSEAVGCAIERMLNVNRTLKVLNLSGCQVTDPIINHILTGLTKNTSLVTLDMGSPKLSVSCAVSLFQQMTTHPTLSITVGEVNVLGVGRVKMDRGCLWWVIGVTIPEICVEFFRALNDSCMTFSMLNVVDLTDQTAEHFAFGLAESQSVQVLDLRANSISSTGAVSIFRSLEHNTSLEELDLSENSQLAEGDCEAVGCAIERMLNVNRTLKVLNLSGCQVTDPIVNHILTGLTKNTSLVTIDMGSLKLSVSCAVSLFQQTTTHPTPSITVGEVNVLGVGRVKMDRGCLWCVIGVTIPENCVEFFRALNDSCMTFSMLNVVDLTDQTAEHFAFGLAESQSVQVLDLRANSISSTGAVSIFRSLEHNTSLEELDLSENSQLAEGDSEAVGCAIERMLNVNRTLKVLNLSGCQVTDPMVKHILTGLTMNTSLVELNIGLYIILSGHCAGSLLQQVINHPTLNITIGKVIIPGVGSVRVDRGTMSCAIIDTTAEQCVEFFRALSNSDVNVSRLEINDQIAEQLAFKLAEGLPIQTLHLRANSFSSTGAVSIVKSLERNTSLEELDLSQSRHLAEGDSEAVGCAIERMLNVNQTLKVLNLAKCGLTNDVASYFANGLAQNHSVRKVMLCLNNIGSTGAVNIFRSLEHNTSLEELDLSENSQLAEGDREVVGCAIERMLNVNRTLKILNLSGCQVTDPIVKHILAGLTKNMSLMNLNIGSCTLHVKCAVPLFQQINNHPTLSISAEVNVVGVGMVKIDREILGCVINYTSGKIPDKFLELFSTLNDSGVKVLNVGVSLGRALLHAAEKGHIHIMKYLIEEQGCDPSYLTTDKYTPLHYAASMGHLDIVKFLTLEKHCNPTSRNSCGTTPIHWAAWYGHLEILKFFITDLKCSPNILGFHGRTPLHYATERGCLHIVKYLIDEQGCDPSCLDRRKQTPLHHAAAFEHLNIVKFLTLEKHCNPNQTDIQKNTPLHYAAMQGHLQVVQFLVEDLKCPPNIRGELNTTPHQMAEAKGHRNVALYLLKFQHSTN